MNPYVKALLVIVAAVLGAYGTAMVSTAVPVNWNAVFGSMASAAGGAILGLFTNMPRSEWSDAQRAVKSGGTDEKTS